MTFTREDILKILNALLQLGRKDSEFKDANTPLNSDDYIAILQDGINKKVSINNLLSTLGLLKKDDFINVSDRYDEYYIHLSEAITIIANNKRKKGLVITFLDIDGNWRIYLFIGELSNFIITDYWKDLHDFKYPIINTVLPDEEDLTLTYPNIEGNSFIKLKDKEYNLDNFSGLGKVILRKNIVEVEDPTYGKIKKNILYQDMINKSNTIYVIQYDFTLGEDITIPVNCVLKFDGGSIIGNGIEKNIIIGNNTSIIAPIKHVFFDVVFEGTVTEDFVLNNFKNSNNCTDSAYNTHRAIHIVGTCIIDAPLVVREHFSIYGDSSNCSKIELDTNYNGEIKTIFLFDSADGGIGHTSFRNFNVTDIDYVFYRNCNSRAESTGSIFLTTYENLYFENISKSLFYVKCYGFSTAKINNIFVGGQCNNEGEALMWFDVYYFNYNIISGSNFSGLAVKKLMYVYTADNQDEYGELNLNSILNSRFENIYLSSSNTEGCLIHFSSKNVLYSTNIEGNYIERIYKSDSTLATIFRFSIAQHKILRQINVTNNFLNGEFENFIYFDANVVIVNLIGNSPLVTQNITCGKEFLYDIAKINNSCTFNIIAPNTSIYNLIEENNISKINNFDGKLRNVVYSKFISANSYIDIKLIPDGYHKPIYYSDVQITYGNRQIIIGKIASIDGINFEFTKTFGNTDVLTTNIVGLDGNLRLSNISDNTLDVRIGVFIANYEE